jgi:sugar phosphate permease
VTQLTGFTGTAGNLASAYPLAVALRDFGWTPTYLAAALAGGSALLLPLLVIRDRPGHGEVEAAVAIPRPRVSEPDSLAEPLAAENVLAISQPRAAEVLEPQPDLAREAVLTQLRAGWARTGTRLGFWIHFTTPFAGGVFSLLWGYPFLVQGEGVSPGAASGLLTLMVAEAMFLGPLYGTLTGRRPRLRMPLTATVITLNATAWAAVLLYPGRAPLGLVVALVVALGTGGPASLVGFEVARDANPRRRVGTVSGMVNVGGFSAMVLLLIGIGFVLDASGGDGAGHYTLAGFKAAFACQYLLYALGVTQLVRLTRRLARERRAEYSTFN